MTGHRLHSFSELSTLFGRDAEARLTAEAVRQIFDYDEKRGGLIWKVAIGPRAVVGSMAGTKHKSGYWRVTVFGRVYTVSHLVWLYIKGVWPDGELDHRDRNKNNNFIGNFRPATRQQNEANKASRNKLGFKGISVEKKTGLYVAEIKIAGVRKYLGAFRSAELAAEAYQDAAVAAHGSFACFDRRHG